jgi:hypothetical protein
MPPRAVAEWSSPYHTLNSLCPLLTALTGPSSTTPEHVGPLPSFQVMKAAKAAKHQMVSVPVQTQPLMTMSLSTPRSGPGTSPPSKSSRHGSCEEVGMQAWDTRLCCLLRASATTAVSAMSAYTARSGPGASSRYTSAFESSRHSRSDARKGQGEGDGEGKVVLPPTYDSIPNAERGGGSF